MVRPADSQPKSSYYAIGDLVIDGQCACFGHAAYCTGPVRITTHTYLYIKGAISEFAKSPSLI